MDQGGVASDEDTQSDRSESTRNDVFLWKECNASDGNRNLICQEDGTPRTDNSIKNARNVTSSALPQVLLEAIVVTNTEVDLDESSVMAGRTEVISQLDGNTSIDTRAPDVTNVANLSPPAVPSATMSSTSTSVRNRVTASASLPVIAVINCRSLQPKVRSLVEKFKNEDFSIGILCEIWEKTGKKNSFFSI